MEYLSNFLATGLTRPREQRRTWSHYQDTDALLYIRTHHARLTTNYQVFFPTTIPQADRPTHYDISFASDTVNELPDDSFPIEVQEDQHQVCITRFTHFHQSTMFSATAPRQNKDFGKFISSLDPWEAELLQHVQLRQNHI